MDQGKLKRYLAIGIGIILGIVIVVLAFSLLQNVFTRASNVAPQDVIVSEIGTNTAKITWATSQEAQSVVEYGTSPTSLSFFAPEAQKATNHEVELTLLSAQTTYYFQIRVGDKTFDNGGIPWTFTTKSQEESKSLTPTKAPTPAQSLETPTPATQSSCTETDCEAIKGKLGKGCTTQDYFKCVRRLTGTPTPTP